MAAKGFIELLKLSQRGKAQNLLLNSSTEQWSGVAFRLGHEYFVAPLGEVSEVIFLPEIIDIPQTHDWFLGLANVSGKIIAISDLSQCFEFEQVASSHRRVLCIYLHQHQIGLVVDQVFGIQHFQHHQYCTESEISNPKLAPFCQGYFQDQQNHWHVFLFSQLLQSPLFMDVAQ
jgi:twitching motility protein PilI